LIVSSREAFFFFGVGDFGETDRGEMTSPIETFARPATATQMSTVRIRVELFRSTAGPEYNCE